VANQYGVRGLAVKCAIGFVDQFILGQGTPAAQEQGFIKLNPLGTDQAYRIVRKGVWHSAKERLIGVIGDRCHRCVRGARV